MVGLEKSKFFISFSWVPLLEICIILPKPPVYLFICIQNMGHAFIQTMHF